MILELDCGNSLIKWRLLSREGHIAATGQQAGGEELLAALPASVGIEGCRLVSVRSEDETRQLLQALQQRLGCPVLQALPAQQLAGVSNGYADYQRLGMDRWLAILGAYQLAGTACLVLDLGTAVTADLVDAAGRHLGGYIGPGLALMRRSLFTHTSRIRYGEQPQLSGRELAPGSNTRDAVENGCQLMLQGFILCQLEQARMRLGSSFEVFVTGGDASVAMALLPGARHVNDLVFHGLAIACPFDWG